MTSITEQLQTLSVYIPPAVARLAYKDPHRQPGGTHRYFFAAGLLVDLSGFIAPLAETVATNGAQEAEELTTILNRVFTPLVNSAEAYGGQVAKICGDMLTIVWPVPEELLTTATRQAVEAAFAIQAAMAAFTTITTSRRTLKLQLKMGLTAGKFLEVHAGGVYNRWEYVLAGQPLIQMALAKNIAAAGTVVADASAWVILTAKTGLEADAQAEQHPLPHVIGEPVAPGFYHITHLSNTGPARPLISPDWAQLPPADAERVATILRSYIPGAILNQLEGGRHDGPLEPKPMTLCLLGFDGFDDVDDPGAGTRLDSFFRDAQEIVYFYEGSINKLTVGAQGNSLLVLFGAPPFFHEDDEVRAIACALSLCKAAVRHNLTVRAGVAAGTVFAGPLGASQRREYSVVGDAVNLAGYLLQLAGESEVLVDQSAQGRAERFFEYESRGEFTGQGQGQGQAGPRHFFRALREKEQDQQNSTATYLLTELTGRGKELDYFEQLAGRIWDGYGQVLLVSGEAGVGKSRLAGEFVRRWLERGGVPHTGDCVSYGRQTPYLPWRGILGSIAGVSPRLSLEQRLTRIESLLGQLPLPVLASGGTVTETYWRERLPLLATILGLECEENDLTRNLSETLRRDNIFATIRAIVLHEARQRPLLLLLEDTHWSDELSLELAADIGAELANTPVFLVLVHRPLSGSIPVSYQRLQTTAGAAQLEVNELEPEASLTLVKNKLGVTDLPAPLAELILSKAQGNPFFTEEMVNALRNMAALEVDHGVCRLTTNLDQLDLPDTVQDVVRTRIDGLKEEEKQTLKSAAVIGRSFQLDLLEAVHTRNSGVLPQEHLTHLQRDDFIRQEGAQDPNDFLFKHVIIQEVAYETIPPTQRRRLHTSIGTTLENRYGNSEGEIIDLLAFHFARSDDRHKALHYLRHAGRRALNGHANQAAISYFSEALAIATEIDVVKVQYNLLSDREVAHNRLGNRTAQADDLAGMRRLALTLKDQEQLIETGNRQLQLATNLGDYQTAITTAHNTLALARQTGQLAGETRTLTNLGITYWRQGDYEQAKTCMEGALQSSDLQLKATSSNYLGLIHTQLANYEQARAYYQQALEYYQATGDRGGQAGCANNMGLLESSLGFYQRAETYYSQALNICHAIGDRLREGISLNTLGQVNTLLGNTEPAKEQLSHSLSIRQAIGDRRGEAFCLHDLGFLYLFSGQEEPAISMFHNATNLRQTLGETGNYVASLTAMAEAHLTKGDIETAWQYMQEAIGHLSHGSGSGEYPEQYVWWMYSQVCRISGDTAAADQSLRQAYQMIRQKADQITDPEMRQTFLTNVRINAAIVGDAEFLD